MSTSPAISPAAPFFIIGCVRSGTTMLRDILRLHPNLACPEETHFYRWVEPFGGHGYRHTVTHNKTLARHRQIDGISDEDFAKMVGEAVNRADLCERYMAEYIAINKPQAKRWFDKTPQNAYGAALIASEFPLAKFVHIVRDPINVVASLRIGKVMKMVEVVGASNYWNEAIANLAVLKRAFPRRVLEISYEEFTADPIAGIQEVLEFLGEPYEPGLFSEVTTREVTHQDEGVLSEEDVARVRQLCLEGRIRHGYASPEEVESERAAKIRRIVERDEQRFQRIEARVAQRRAQNLAQAQAQAAKAQTEPQAGA